MDRYELSPVGAQALPHPLPYRSNLYKAWRPGPPMRLFSRKSKKAGLPPGSLIYTGAKKEGPVTVSVIDYDAKRLEEKGLRPGEFGRYRTKRSVSWINVTGIHDVKVVEELGEKFKLHPLVMEDILSPDQRPKLEEYDDQVYIVLRMLKLEQGRILSEQLSLVLGKGYVLSFQENEGDVFDAVRDRIRKGKGRIRGRNADYLAYALVDAIVDGYFAILEHVGEQVEGLETSILRSDDSHGVERINALKREALYLRRSVWPLREVLSGLQRNGHKLIEKRTLPFLRDVYDHTIQVIDTIETIRDMTSGMLDIYLSSVSNRMNEVMKVLTIIATIFIPLTFITGLYGMNFSYMPELGWRPGYFTVLGVMFLILLGQLWYFRRKGWL